MPLDTRLGALAQAVGADIKTLYSGRSIFNASTTAQGPGFASDTYLAGSACLIPTGRVKAGTMYRCKFHATKTAAGVATPVINLRVGTAGTTADTSRVALTFAAQTAVADEAFIEVWGTFRAAGATAVLQGVGMIDHTLAATGFSTANTSIKNATSAAFDATAANLQVGLSVNAGSAAAWTVTLVQAELQNLA